MKKILPVSLLFIAALTLAGCGGGTSESKSSSKSETSSGTSGSSTSEVKPTEVTFDFWHTFGQGIEEGVQALADEFSELIKRQEGVNVTVNLSKEGSYNEILKKITTGIGTGNSPTLAVAYPDHVAQYIANESKPGQFVIDLTKFINDKEIGFGKEAFLGDKNGDTVYDADDIIESYFQEGISYVNDGVYSIPLMKSTEVMMYNLEVVTKALKKLYPSQEWGTLTVQEHMDGISWDELLKISKSIADNKVEFAVPQMEYPVYYDSDSNMIISSMYQEEIPYSSVGEDKKGRIDFDYQTQPENYNKTKELVNSFVDAHKKGLLTTKGTNNGEYGSYSFTDEKTAITIGSSGGAGYNAPKTSDQYTVMVARPPVLNDNPLYVNQGVTLTMLNNVGVTESENYWKQYYAWKFIKYLTNPEVNAVLCVEDSQGYVPVRYSAYKSSAFIEWLSQPETIMIKSAKVVMEMNEDEAYYTAKSFSGASELRDQMGGVITTLFLDVEKPTPETTTDAVLKQAIDVAKTKF